MVSSTERRFNGGGGDMKFKNFRITAAPYLEGRCKCGAILKEVGDGFHSSALFCPRCEKVYTIKLVQVPAKKISADYLEQCKREAI